MEVISKISDDILRIGVVGELDASGAINLDRILQNAIQDKCFNILVDCQKLDYISSAGLRVFISHLGDIQDNKGKLVFYNMNDKVKHIFNILGLHNVITITGDLNQAKKMIHED